MPERCCRISVISFPVSAKCMLTGHIYSRGRIFLLPPFYPRSRFSTESLAACICCHPNAAMLPLPMLATQAVAQRPNSTCQELIAAAVQDYHTHGFCIMPAGTVPKTVCGDDLKFSAISEARWRISQTDKDRTSINSRHLLQLPPWRALFRHVVSADSTVGQILDELFGDAWWFDRMGGEVVAPLARFDENSCSPHSDWRNVPKAVVAVSVYVHNTVDEDRAPLVLYSKCTNRKVICTGQRGMVIIRDVDVIHRGQVNHSMELKAVPCLRFFLPNALRQEYNPTRFLTYDQAIEIAGDDPWIMEKLLLVIQSDTTAMSTEQTTRQRLPLPASMGEEVFDDADTPASTSTGY